MQQLWLIPALPLTGFLINGIFGRRFSKALINAIAIGSVVFSFAWALKTVLALGDTPFAEHYFDWIVAGGLRVGCDFAVDRLTSVMLLVVTGVGSLIHIYSTGYMEHEGGYYRFFAYLNLFMFFMLTLVLAANYLLLFVGWEGVGLCSYLLIGFWFHKKSATDAGNKAFIVNRIGDFGFSLAMLMIVINFGSLDFGAVFGAAASRPEGVLTAIAMLLLVGACGKSAQFPLYVWLPDAMEGPTPVSALIHAATMVTAGVYVVARSFPIFIHAPAALEWVACIGLFTATFAATIGLAQNDIKKVFAYSTVSQLGYMFLGAGVGAFSAGIFHLMTHAFFKACLFLCAGSVMHALHGELNVFKMGGLRRKLPITATTFLLAALAISGFPGFSGFFSKDLILESAFTSGHTINWLLGLLAAGMTAFYVFRAYFLAFEGDSRLDPEKAHHVHEAPPSMTIPLIILAALAVVGGWIGLPEGFLWGNRFTEYLAPSLASLPHAEAHHVGGATLAFLILSASTMAIGGIALAYAFYGRRSDVPERVFESAPGAYRVLWNKYYVDELYEALIIGPYVTLSRVFWQVVDSQIIDGSVNGIGELVGWIGGRTRRLQTGNVQTYALAMLFGALCVIIALAI
jgi:NADH-quinone oxidoreductase subunit L